MNIQQKLVALDACNESQKWAKDKTWEEIYKTCPRGDWLLWLFKRTNPENVKELFMAKALCANTVRHLMRDKRSTDAIDATIKFANGEITALELRLYAAAAADAAADTSAAYAATYVATYVAAYAAAAADAAADTSAAYAATYVATYVAAYAADAAAADAAAAAAAAARRKNQQETADICRKIFPIELWNINN